MSAPSQAAAPAIIEATAVPRLAHGFRLQFEPAQDAHVLLYPEGMVRLNATGAAIMTRCDGVRSVGEIVAELEAAYSQSGLYGDVSGFIALAAQRGWLALQR